MIQKYKLLLIVSLIAVFANAQDFNIDLEKLELTGLKEASFHVDSVIDARANKVTLGYILEEKSREYTTVFPVSPVATSLQAVLKNDEKNAANCVIIRLNRLFIYQTSIKGTRHLSVEASLTFITKSNREYLEQFTSTQTLRKEAQYGNRLVSELIQEALDICLQDYVKRKKSGMLSNVLISEKDLNTGFSGNEVTVKNMPYHIRGLFYTFYDFRDYSIDTKTPFLIAVVKSELHEPRQVKLKFNDRSMRKKEIYAFSNGKNLFVKTGKYYIEVTDTSGEFWLNRYEEFSTTTTEYNAGIVVAGVMGGLVGVGIYAAITKKPLANKYMLDFERGAVVPADYPQPDEITSQILIYGSDDLEDTDTITVEIGEDTSVRLGRNQYYVYESDDRCEPVIVCAYWGGMESCTQVTPKILNTAIVQCELNHGKVQTDILSKGRENSVEAAVKSEKAARVYTHNN